MTPMQRGSCTRSTDRSKHANASWSPHRLPVRHTAADSGEMDRRTTGCGSHDDDGDGGDGDGGVASTEVGWLNPAAAERLEVCAGGVADRR